MTIRPAADSAAPPVDLRVLARFADRPKLQQELLTLFQLHAIAEQPALRMALRLLDLDTIARLTHRLRGAAEIIGALELAAVCRDIEAAARRGDADAVAAKRTPFEQELARVIRWLDQRPAPSA